MLTLRELLLEVNKDDYFRIYNPNRDCLEFESFYSPHDPWNCDNGHTFLKPAWRTSYEELDDETKKLLDDYGDYEVFSIECSSTSCIDFYKNENGGIEWKRSDAYPHEHAPVLNIFIRPGRKGEDILTNSNESITNLMSGMMSGDLLKQEDLPEAHYDENSNSKGLYSDIACPYCGKRHFQLGSCMTTAMYCPTIIKDGKVVSNDHNTSIQHCYCLECGGEFEIRDGKVEKIPPYNPQIEIVANSNKLMEDYYKDRLSSDELTSVFANVIDNDK